MARGFQSRFKRRVARDPKDIILVSCEGEQTEPRYFRRLEALYNFKNLRLDPGTRGTDFDSVVRRAKQKCRTMEICDCVYLACDGDTLRGRVLGQQGPFRLAVGRHVPVKLALSQPCFEYWILLHFEFTDAPMTSAEVLERLRRHWASYEKAGDFTFLEKTHVETARMYAARLREQERRHPEVFTDVDLLVEHLLREQT